MWSTISRGNPDRVVFHPGPVFRLDSGDTGAFVGGEDVLYTENLPDRVVFHLAPVFRLDSEDTGASLGGSIVYCI